MSTFPIPQGILPFCEGKWDEGSKRYVPTSSLDVIQCCLKTCKTHPQFCVELCDSLYDEPEPLQRCYAQCDDLSKECEDACLTLPSKGMTIMRDCAEEKGCGKPPYGDSCVEEKKEDILNCCRSACISEQSLDCDNRCDELFGLLSGKVGFIPNKSAITAKESPPKSRKVVWIVLIASILLLFMVLFYKKRF